MLVKIYPSGWGDGDDDYVMTFKRFLSRIGLVYVSDTIYKVIDEQLFFLSVIKHGIKFEPYAYNEI